MSNDEVEISVDVAGRTLLVGFAFFHRRRQSVATTFTYAPDFLADPDAFAIDPTFPLTGGSHYRDDLPGAFDDAAPDRWGRNLIAKQIRGRALLAGRTAPSVSAVDYLLGVSDLTRQGALRFRRGSTGPYLAEGSDVPKLIELPRLLRAAQEVEKSRGDDIDAVKVLLDAGTGSLGGARPKASVRDEDGRLLIAKFPHHHDDWDVSGWEKTALDLAERSGLSVPPRRTTLVGQHHVLLVERFDRTAIEDRVPYSSAMTLLGAKDGELLDYTDIAEVIAEVGAGKDDLEELFRRAVFNSAVRNTDDHLRNHGFIREPGIWRLSPAFDLNPNPDQRARRQTSIGGADEARDEPAGLFVLAGACRLERKVVDDIVKTVIEATTAWRSVAAGNGLTKSEIDRFDGSLDPQLARLREMIT